MSEPHKCPICLGQGKVFTPPWIAGDQSTYGTTTVQMFPCHACLGTGIVWSPAAAEAVSCDGTPMSGPPPEPPPSSVDRLKDVLPGAFMGGVYD